MAFLVPCSAAVDVPKRLAMFRNGVPFNQFGIDGRTVLMGKECTYGQWTPLDMSNLPQSY